MTKIILGITGGRRVGKDTFFNLLQNLYPEKSFTRVAFADQLKEDLLDLSLNLFNKGVELLNDEEKEIFRPIMVSYGCAWRAIDPLHWVKSVEERLNYVDELELSITPTIIDVRFPNEIVYLREQFPDKRVFLVEIERIGAPEPTDEEKKNIPLLKQYVDYNIVWPTVGDNKIAELRPYVENAINFLKI